MKAIRKSTMRNAAGWMALASLAVSVRAGVVVEQEGGEVGGNKPKTKMTLYLDSGKLRMEGQQPDGKKFAVIFDGNQQVMWMLSPDQGTYTEMRAAQIEQLGQQMNQAMQQLQAQMASVPPEQRAMVEEMMKKSMGGMGGAPAAPTITVQEKGSGEKVGAFTTTHYAVMTNGQMTQEVWAASVDQVHLTDADFKTFQAMAKFYEPLTRNAPRGSYTTTAMQQIKGMPVRTLIYDGPKPSFEWTVVKAENKSVDGGMFTVPPNLKKAAMDMGPGMRMGGR